MLYNVFAKLSHTYELNLNTTERTNIVIKGLEVISNDFTARNSAIASLRGNLKVGMKRNGVCSRQAPIHISVMILCFTHYARHT